MATTNEPLAVVVAAGRAEWEPAALADLAAARMIVLRRCVDLEDLLGAAMSGQADLALISSGLSGIDADAVRRLAAVGIGVVAVTDTGPDQERMRRLGITACAATDVVAALRRTAADVGQGAPDPVVDGGLDVGPAHRGEVTRAGKVVAIWGPTGAPGRTTVALALAAERGVDAAGHHRVLLCDVDPYGGTIAQRVGVVEEVSGLLAVARLANEGALDHVSLAGCLRSIGGGVDVLTGLPRPERWREIREGVVGTTVELARTEADVVIDCGFGIETGSARSGLPRDIATLEALGSADEVVVVGSAEPAGLTRLARGLVALTEVVERPPSVAVVNRMRDSLGWRHADVEAMIDGFAPGVPVQFWPEERQLLDRALVSARSLVELGEHSLRGPARSLVESVFGAAQVPKSR